MEHPKDYERRDTNSLFISIFAAVCIVSIVVSIFGLDFYFDYMKEKVQKEAEENQEVKALVDEDKDKQNEILEKGITVKKVDGGTTTSKKISEAMKEYSEKDQKERK